MQFTAALVANGIFRKIPIRVELVEEAGRV